MAYFGNGPACSSSRINVNPCYMPDPRQAGQVSQVFFRREADELQVLELALNTLKFTNTSPVLEFDQMNLKPELLQGIIALGLDKPGGCQQNVILPMIQGRDVICQAGWSMGKTAAFCIAILQRLDLNDPNFKVLVLAPTRELAQQILTEFQAFSCFMNVNYISCIGGIKMSQMDKMTVQSGNFHVAVGTAGRISQLLSDKIRIDEFGRTVYALDGDTIEMLIIDEADYMFTGSLFTRNLINVFQKISPMAQIIASSATMSSIVFDRCCKVMRNPFTFLLPNDQLTLDRIRQFYIKVTNDDDKLLILDDLFLIFNEASGIIFCSTTYRAKMLAAQLQAQNYQLVDMTRNFDQNDQTSRFWNFKNGLTRLLFASDLLTRGLDMHHVQVVVNYDIPKSNLEYIHRIGRTGRYGKNGVAITLVTDAELKKINELEKYYSIEIKEFDLKNKEPGSDWSIIRSHLFPAS